MPIAARRLPASKGKRPLPDAPGVIAAPSSERQTPDGPPRLLGLFFPRRRRLHRLTLAVHLVARETHLAFEHTAAHARVAARAIDALTHAIQIVRAAPG